MSNEKVDNAFAVLLHGLDDESHYHDAIEILQQHIVAIEARGVRVFWQADRIAELEGKMAIVKEAALAYEARPLDADDDVLDFKGEVVEEDEGFVSVHDAEAKADLDD